MRFLLDILAMTLFVALVVLVMVSRAGDDRTIELIPDCPEVNTHREYVCPEGNSLVTYRLISPLIIKGE